MPHLHPTRRDLLGLAAAMPALTLPALSLPALLAPSGARADLGPPAAGNPAHFSFGLGEAQLTVVSDGHLETPASGLGVNADPDEVRAFLQRHFLSQDTNYGHANHLVIEIGEAVVLVDVGSGNRFLPTAGRLMDNLGAAGIDPASITHVALTHAHPDHLWGIRDDFDEALLPDATYVIGETERAFWSQPGLVDEVAPEMQQFVVGAVNSFAVEGANWQVVPAGHEIVPGVQMVATPGHTPGHMSVQITSGGQRLIALGDAMTHVWMNFERPDWTIGFDWDGPQAAATRKRLLEMAAAERVALLGYHFPFPGVGHVMRAGDGYRFVPALWRW